MKHAFMREPLRQFSAAAMNRVLKVSRSGFYDGATAGPPGVTRPTLGCFRTSTKSIWRTARPTAQSRPGGG